MMIVKIINTRPDCDLESGPLYHAVLLKLRIDEMKALPGG
jgi:hypothetical protein